MYKKRRSFRKIICMILAVVTVLAVPLSGFSLSPESDVVYGNSLSLSPEPNAVTYGSSSAFNTRNQEVTISLAEIYLSNDIPSRGLNIAYTPIVPGSQLHAGFSFEGVDANRYEFTGSAKEIIAEGIAGLTKHIKLKDGLTLGNYSATLEIDVRTSTNLNQGMIYSIPIVETSSPSYQLDVSHTQLNYTEPGESRLLTIRNTGNMPVDLRLSTAGGFLDSFEFLNTPDEPRTLLLNESVTFGVRLKRSVTPGTVASAQINVEGLDSNNIVAIETVSLAAAVAQKTYDITLGPSELNFFTKGQGLQVSVINKNTKNTFLEAKITGPDASLFTIETRDNKPFPLEFWEGNSTSFVIKLSDTMFIGKYHAQLEVSVVDNLSVQVTETIDLNAWYGLPMDIPYKLNFSESIKFEFDEQTRSHQLIVENASRSTKSTVYITAYTRRAFGTHKNMFEINSATWDGVATKVNKGESTSFDILFNGSAVSGRYRGQVIIQAFDENGKEVASRAISLDALIAATTEPNYSISVSNTNLEYTAQIRSHQLNVQNVGNGTANIRARIAGTHASLFEVGTTTGNPASVVAGGSTFFDINFKGTTVPGVYNAQAIIEALDSSGNVKATETVDLSALIGVPSGIYGITVSATTLEYNAHSRSHQLNVQNTGISTANIRARVEGGFADTFIVNNANWTGNPAEIIAGGFVVFDVKYIGMHRVAHSTELIIESLDSSGNVKASKTVELVKAKDPYFLMLYDSLSFGNHPKSFGYQDIADEEPYDYEYVVPLEIYTDLFGKSTGKFIYKQIGPWNGSCFGMNAVNSVFFHGDVDYRKFSPNPSPINIYSIEAPASPDYTLTKMIETYQITQYKHSISKTLSSNTNKLEELIELVQLFEEGKHQEIPLINVGTSKGGGHSIVAYAVKNVGLDNERKFELSIYDNNHPDDITRVLPIDLDTGEWSYLIGIKDSGEEISYSSESGNDFITFVNHKEVFEFVDKKVSFDDTSEISFSVPLDSLITDAKGTDIAIVPGAYEVPYIGNPLLSPPVNSYMFRAPAGTYKIKSPVDNNKAEIFSNGEGFSLEVKGANSEIIFSSDTKGPLKINAAKGFELELWNELTADDSVVLSTPSPSDVTVSQENRDITVSSYTGSSEITVTNSNGSNSFIVSPGVDVKITDKLSVTVGGVTTLPTPHPTNHNKTQSNSSGSVGTNKVDVSPNNLTSKKTKASITWLDSSALKMEGNKATLRSAGKFGLKKDAIDSLLNKQLEVDTIEGTIIKVRINIPNPSLLASKTPLSAAVRGDEVNRTKNIFAKAFKNQVAVISFDNKELWKQSVRVSALVDLSGMDEDNLKFYSYNSTTNRYMEIITPNYEIDTNGYLSFTTRIGGEIVLSSGALVK